MILTEQNIRSTFSSIKLNQNIKKEVKPTGSYLPTLLFVNKKRLLYDYYCSEFVSL